jgi:chromosome segregation protein
LFLRSLTIKGFKSFARKTVLEFEPGVTIIVGPNGSGKSNIADAVMWVLGEQSPTSLRGNRMEDIIFSGSSSLKPVNIAEVSLVLDNSNNDFPLEYSEVIVTRNVVRGGDSEYRLNNSLCRLLDIQELLSDAGVGRTLNSVISQGNLDEVLTCRPEERRDYIEEAGGLLKYRKRREKAIRRLARMDEEIVRTNDVAREVRRQLRPLQRQAGRLEQYQGLVGELKEARLKLDVVRLRAMRREWQEHEERQKERSETLARLDAEIREKAAEAGALEKAQAQWRTREANLRDGLYRLVSLHERLKAMLVMWEEKARRARDDEGALKPPDPAEIESAARECQELTISREAFFEQQEALKQEDTRLAARAADLNTRLNELVRERAGLEARLEVISARSAAAPREGGAVRDRQAEARQAAEELEGLRGRLDGLDEIESDARERVSGLEQQIESLNVDRARVLTELRAAEREQAGLVATLEILTRLETRQWTPANTSAALLETDPTGGALGGTLVENMTVEDSHETAILGFLGPWLHGVVAKDAGAVTTAIEHLKKHGLGQGLFFKYDGEKVAAGQAPIEGARLARDAVEAPDWFGDALDTLLDGVYLVDGLKEANALASEHPRAAFLTPDGDVITGGALQKGGSPQVSDAVLQMTADRRQALEDSLAVAREKVETMDLEQSGGAVAIEKAAAALIVARSELEEASGSLSEARSLHAALTARIEALSSEYATGDGIDLGFGADPAVLRDRADELRVEEAGIAAELSECEAGRRETADQLRIASSELASVERRLEIGRIKERDLRARDRGRAQGPAVDEGEIARLVSLHEKLAGQLELARQRTRRLMDEGAQDEKGAAEGLRGLREKVAELQVGHEALRDQIHGEELSTAEIKVRVEQLVDRITDEHKVPLDFALKHYPEDEPTAELEEKVEALSLQLEHIGPVNPEAIIERESLEQRYDFLKTQMDDIDKARSQLKRVITQVDREIEQKFAETLEKVNGHFMKIFATLFPNGSAELRLTDPDDLLNTGVEIMAQPQGKRLRRISLLSGGETSMTAIAFFFSLFKVRPSPFYFLDEVEAALDDVNLHRFLDLVREFKGESQLVLITHQKRSMEIADILYGVTMQDDGMSRVLSQRIEERAAS